MNIVEICVFLCTNNLFYVKMEYLRKKKVHLWQRKDFATEKTEDVFAP